MTTDDKIAEALLRALGPRLEWSPLGAGRGSVAWYDSKHYDIVCFSSPFLGAPIWLATCNGYERLVVSLTEQQEKDDCEVHVATGAWPRHKRPILPLLPFASSARHLTPPQCHAIKVLKRVFLRDEEDRRFGRHVRACLEEDRRPLAAWESSKLMALLHDTRRSHWACCCPKCIPVVEKGHPGGKDKAN